jgi:hypothetical protein
MLRERLGNEKAVAYDNRVAMKRGYRSSLESDVRWKRETFLDNDEELLTPEQPCEGLLACLTRQFESIVQRQCHYADTPDLLVIVVHFAFQRIQDRLRDVIDIGSRRCRL